MAEYIPDDPLFSQQWHLKNTGQVSFAVPGVDLNVTQVWPDYSGVGIKVGVYDNGVDYNHPDLNDNYDASLQVTFNGNPVDPIWQVSPDPSRYQTLNYHGTEIAGAIAAEDNDIGGVGVAFGANVTGVLAPFGGNPPDAQLVQALQQLTNFDIATFARRNGTFNDGRGNPNFSSFWTAIDNAVASGRDGLGTILVRGAGNLGPNFGGEDGNAAQFQQDYTLITVGAVKSDGVISPYVTRGSNMLVSGLSGFNAEGDLHNIVTTDISGAPGQNSGDYAAGGGTSLSHPLVAGVVALMLEANPGLGWRDVQTILANSARHIGASDVGEAPNTMATETDGWKFNNANNWNGGGRHFSNDYGFGLVDALAAVRMAETWLITGAAAATSSNQSVLSVNTDPGSVAIPDNNGNSVSFSFTVASDIRLESARVFFNITHSRAQDLHITLTSPYGTVSEIFNPPIGDSTQVARAFQGSPPSWGFTSQEFRGELTAGTWTVTITDLVSGNAGSLGASATLQLRGSTAGVTNSRYVYTNEFSDYADLSGRATLTDTDGGNDTINAAAVTVASNINLNAGVAGSIDGHVFTIAPGSDIENAIGGDGDDTLSGNALANLLHGGRGNDMLDGGDDVDSLQGGVGNDILIGGAGADGLDGGEGSDTASYVSATAGITARLDLLFGVDDGGAFDTYIGIENATGSDFADVIVGKVGESNILSGGAGDDTFIGEGIDSFDGGSGNDVLFGGQSFAGLNLDLAIIGIETVWGSFVADIMDGSTATANLTLIGQGLTGGTDADTMTGGSGDDFIYFRAGDVINGGAGNDWAVATLSASGVILNMTATGFENAWGSTSNDSITAAGSATTAVLVGDAGNDILTGGNAGDFLYGFGDDDTLTGGGGNDNLIGGDGNDTFVFGANWGTDIVWDWVNGSEQFDVQGSGATGFGDLTVNQNYFGSGNALITFAGNQILVVGGANQITSDDFLF